MQDAFPGGEVEVVAVGFSPPDALAPLAGHLGWRGPFLSDTGRRLYRRLGWGRAPWWRVYSPGTLAIYLRAARRGRADHRRPASGEDTRQLGGDALVRGGRAVVRWSPRSPDDRVPVADLVAAARDGT